jgi:hypothetical protein
MQSLERDFYFCTLGSFDHDFTRGGMNVKMHALKTPIITRFVSKIIMFKETLEFKQTILLCSGG